MALLLPPPPLAVAAGGGIDGAASIVGCFSCGSSREEKLVCDVLRIFVIASCHASKGHHENRVSLT
eukprot:scaffold27234_cov72-Skeletonema_dohrnii-CCMP3373.AAC.1